MNWERCYCPNQACAVGEWMVRRDPATPDIWWVAEHEHDRPFTVAASDPVCPRCGLTLVGIVELEGALIAPAGAGAGSVFNFVRSRA